MKILKTQDLHVSPKWLDESIRDIDRICEVATTEKVDAITIAGDFFDGVLFASDRNNWKVITEQARKLQKPAPVFFVYGTRSHDNPGAYESFLDIGWREINIGKSETIGDLLIMGIQEISPAFLIGQYPELSKQEIIAEQYNLINGLIDSYYAPLAMSHKGPVLFMGHGHVQGVKFRDDQKPRSSDFMYSESMLERIGADYIQFGHIHLPQEFKSIKGSYGGGMHLTWNDIGFKPGFDVMTFTETQKPFIQRFDFDKPERQKIVIKDGDKLSKAYDKIKPNSDLWIDIECNKEFADQFDKIQSLSDLNKSIPLGPLSKITTNIQHVEHVRVDTEEYEKAQTLEDIYKIYDPEASKSILLKVNEVERETQAEQGSESQHTFQFLDLYLKGSKAGHENGVEEIRMNWEDFQNGINLITGANGTGKSFSLGSCNPFSVHLPTGIDLKSLFESKDSQAVRRFRDGDNIITQKILIDPTLAAPSAKYYMDINGDPVKNVTGNKKPFDDAVTEIFGTIKMFMACTFRGQKDNKDYPSLEKAKESDLRQIYTELAGIDKSHMKKYSHDKAVEFKRNIELDSREIETLEGLLLQDVNWLEQNIVNKTGEITVLNTTLVESNTDLEALRIDIVKLDRVKTENEGINKQIQGLEIDRDEVSDVKNSYELQLKTATDTLDSADNVKVELENLKSQETRHTVASGKYFDAQGLYNTDLDAWREDTEYIQAHLENIVINSEPLKKTHDDAVITIKDYENIIKGHNEKIEYLNKPCEHCGKLSTTLYEEMQDIEILIKTASDIIVESREVVTLSNKALDILRPKWSELNNTLLEKPKEPESLPILKKSMDDLKIDTDKLNSLQSTVDNLKSTEDRKIELESLIKQKSERLEEITIQIIELNSKLIEVDERKYTKLSMDIQILTAEISTATADIATLETEIKTLEKSLTDNDTRIEKITDIKKSVSVQQINITEWEKLDAAFSPKGIEALELSLFTPQVDRKANQLLQIHGTRFKVETITQDMDSKNKNLLERFKILVHDCMANEPKNLPVLSGSQAIWNTSAIREAISYVSSQKYGRIYDYSILDEADASIDTIDIVRFYDMIGRIIPDKKTIAVTHSTEVQNSIENVKDITDFFVGYGS